GRCKWLLYRTPIANTRSDAHIGQHDVAVDRSPWSLACELVVGAGFQADRRDRAEIDVGLDDIPIGGGACSLGGDPMLVGRLQLGSAGRAHGYRHKRLPIDRDRKSVV